MGDSLAPAPQPVVLTNNTDDATFQLPLAIASNENGYYVVTNQGVFQWQNFGSAPSFAALPTIGQPNNSLGRDGVMFQDNLHVAGGNSVAYYNGTSWTTPTALNDAFNSSYPLRLCVYQDKVSLCVGNQNFVYIYNTSYTLIWTLTLPVEYIVTGMVWRQNQMYIFTRNVSGGTATMFVWNGAGVAAQFGFGVQADWIYAGCEYDNTIAIVTSAGQILKFNSGGFDELDHFPVYDTRYSWSSSSSLINGTGKVGFRGMIAIGERLVLNIDGSINSSGNGYPGVYLPNQPSGIWEYTPNNGLSHKAGYCVSKYNTLSVTDLGSSILVLATAHNLVTGDAVYVSSAAGLAGLISNQTYFAIPETTTTLRLALTPYDAAEGNYVTCSGTPSGAQLCTPSQVEIGATLINQPGAIGTFNKNVPNVFFGEEILFGGSTPDHTGTTAYSLMSWGMGRSRSQITLARVNPSALTYMQGQFTQQHMYTAPITFSAGQLVAYVDNFQNAFESIIVKYKRYLSLAYPSIVSGGASGVLWTSGTTFTAAVGERDLAHASVGDEVTMLQGGGAGYSAHIQSITLANNVYTVVLDETIPGISTSDVSEIMVDNYTKLTATISSTQPSIIDGYAVTAIDTEAMFIKLELRGRDMLLRRLALTIKPLNEPL